MSKALILTYNRFPEGDAGAVRQFAFAKIMSKLGYHTYLGHTNSDDDFLTSFMTMDSFIIDEKDFYMDGKNCGW